MGDVQVRVAWPSVWTSWRETSDYYDWRLRLTTPKGVPLGRVVKVAERAADVASAATDAAGYAETFGPCTVSPADTGVVVLFKVAWPKEAAQLWVDTFTAALVTDGVGGRLGPVAFEAGPGWVAGGYPGVGRLGLFACYRLADPADAKIRDGRWAVAADLTTALVQASIDWVEQAAGDRYYAVRVHQSRVADLRVLAPVIADTLRSTSRVTASRVTREPGDHRQVGFDAGGFAGHLVAHEPRDWVREVAELREMLTLDPTRLDLAFIRSTLGVASMGWMQLQAVQPPYPHCEYSHLFRWLCADYTLDAHAIQVLTDSHLAKAADLSDWTITDLGQGRHLVEAPDLQPWLSTDTPDPDVLAKARRDFGAMLLTADISEAARKAVLERG